MHESPGFNKLARLFGSPDVDQKEPQTAAMCVDGTKTSKVRGR